MKYLPKNTLAYYSAAHQFRAIDLSEVPTSVFAASANKYREEVSANGSMLYPNEEAVTFYTLNHLASLIRARFTPNEPLPKWAQDVMSTYLQVTSAQGTRMLHYLVCISVTEMRHLKVSGMSSAFWTEMEQKFGTPAKDFIAKKSGDESQFLASLFSNPPKCGFGKFMAGVAFAFNMSKKAGNQGFGGSFGGPPWGSIAACAASFIQGKTPLEIMVDTAFTLEHNGKCLFNKGYLYHSEDKASLIKILDVQRSGQMPDLILDKTSYGVTKTATAQKAVQIVAEALPGVFRGWVDWFQVQKLGGLGNYTSYQQKQLVQHPESGPKAEPPKPVVPPKPTITKIAGKPVKITGTYQVMPDQIVTVFERVTA